MSQPASWLTQSTLSPPLPIPPCPPPCQVFGRDKSMSIVAVMHVDGIEPEYVAMLNLAAQVELVREERLGQQPPCPALAAVCPLHPSWCLHAAWPDSSKKIRIGRLQGQEQYRALRLGARTLFC